MKNIKFILSILFLSISLTFISCDGGNEPLDPALLNVPIETDNCITPTGLQTTSLNNGTTINLSWSTSGIATSWQVEYGLSDSYIQGAGTKVAAIAPTVNINNLLAINSYTFSVRAVCGTGFGDWSAPKNVIGINPNCANPSGLSAQRTSNPAEVTVNWTAPATQTAWEIAYGPVGFNPTQATNTVQATSKPKLVSGLANTSYDFYVRAKCSVTENSSWVGPINVAAFVNSGSGIVGNYLLTAVNTSFPTNLNGDTVSSLNQMLETSCHNNNFLKINENNTFTADQILPDINQAGTGIECLTELDITGTWTFSNNILTLTYLDGTDTINQSFNFSNNTLSGLFEDVDILNVVAGVPVFAPGNVTEVYTKQ